MPIYRLFWGTYDSNINYCFECPENMSFVDFKKLCNQLMNEAAVDAANGVTKSVTYKRDYPFDSFIGYNFLVEEVAARLPDHGCKKIDFETVEYDHGIILSKEQEADCIFSEEVFNRIIKHNENVTARVFDRAK